MVHTDLIIPHPSLWHSLERFWVCAVFVRIDQCVKHPLQPFLCSHGAHASLIIQFNLQQIRLRHKGPLPSFLGSRSSPDTQKQSPFGLQASHVLLNWFKPNYSWLRAWAYWEGHVAPLTLVTKLRTIPWTPPVISYLSQILPPPSCPSGQGCPVVLSLCPDVQCSPGVFCMLCDCAAPWSRGCPPLSLLPANKRILSQ